MIRRLLMIVVMLAFCAGGMPGKSVAADGVPTIELSKYTWSSSKEAFEAYTLAAARLHAEYGMITIGRDILTNPLSQDIVFQELIVHRSDLYKHGKDALDESEQELANPFYDDAKKYLKEHKEGSYKMPDYFKEKVKNFAVSYGMYVASYNAQKDVKDANEQLALWHKIISGLGSLVEPNNIEGFLKDVSAGSKYNKKYTNLLYLDFFQTMKKQSLDASKGNDFLLT